MKRAAALVLSVCSLVTPACVAADAEAPANEEGALSAWLEDRCPNDAVVQRADTRTGEVRVVPCTEARATILQDDEARAVLRALYEQSRETPASPGGGEPISEAQQQWSPVGLACTVLMTAAGLAFNWPGSKQGCNDPHASNPGACAKVTSFGFGGLGVLCTFI
jgi:hypothetical protein